MDDREPIQLQDLQNSILRIFHHYNEWVLGSLDNWMEEAIEKEDDEILKDLIELSEMEQKIADGVYPSIVGMYEIAANHVSLVSYIVSEFYDGHFHIDSWKDIEKYVYTKDIIKNEDGSMDIKVDRVEIPCESE